MSRASTKAAGRTSKATAANRKKTTKAAKSARKAVKKPSARASRRTSVKTVRRTTAAKRPTTPKTAAKTTTKVVEAVSAPAVAAFLAQAAVIRTASPPTQPAAPELIVQSHKYKVGETVYYTSPSFGRAAANGRYTVVKLLPSDGEDYQYRIKSSGEAFERVAKESQLDRT
jgi:hypothetical protein